MTKNRKSYGGIERCRNFRNLYLSLPDARAVPVKVDPVQADVGATKWVAPSGLTREVRPELTPGALLAQEVSLYHSIDIGRSIRLVPNSHPGWIVAASLGSRARSHAADDDRCWRGVGEMADAKVA